VRSQAFLSYAAEDRSLAEIIARALEERGYAVWWDRRISPGQQFDQSIATALASAGAVVVLWSRHSSASEWVREEALHGKNRGILVPVSLDGSDPPFGFGLRQAVDLSGWNGETDWPQFTTLVDAIGALVAPAGVSNLRPTQPQSLDRRPRRRTIALGAALAIVLAGAAVGGVYWDVNHREHVEHFSNVTRRWGFPEGIGPLTSAQVARRSVSLALIRHGHWGPVDELRLVDPKGDTPPQGTYMPPLALVDLNPLPGTADRFVTELGLTRMTFTHDANDRILEQSAFTRGGRRLYTLHFAVPDLGEYKTDGFATPVRESGISYVRFSRVTAGVHAGFDERFLYLDADRNPQPDERGEYGIRIVLNDKGQAAEKIRLGSALDDAPNAYGALKEVLSYDERGNTVEAWTVDSKGNRTRGLLGTAGARYEYDEAGNFVAVSLYDENGLLVSLPELGAAGRRLTYDERGRLVSADYFGPDRKRVVGKQGFARQTIEWPGPYKALERFFGADEKPLPLLGGAFESISTYNARGLPTETIYHDRTGRPTRLSNGCSTIRLAYDGVGNNTQVDCLDEDVRPTLGVDGYASIRFEFDDQGNALTTSFFDIHGQPGLASESFTSVRRTFNTFGKEVSASYVDSAGKPRRTRSGFAGTRRTYDSRGNQTRETYVDDRGLATTITGGCAGVTSEYDERGREVRTSFVNAAGGPCRHDDGYASAEFSHDASGFVERVTLRDERGSPVRGVDGYAGWFVKRNAAGLRLETTFLDERGLPAMARRLGTTLRRWTYDDGGRVVLQSDHDASGRPVNNAFGYSTIKYLYDEYSRETGREMFDLSGRALETLVTVDKVVAGSVAADTGFQHADAILSYDGEVVRSIYQFTNTLEVFKGDRRREVRVSRGNTIVSLDAPPGRLEGLVLQDVARR